MRVELTEDSVEVLLSRWEKILGLMGDIRIPRRDVSDARLVQDPLKELAGSGLKVGLRLPGFYYVARTIGLDEAFIVRRGTAAVSFRVGNHKRLIRVLASTRGAEELVRRLAA